MSTKYTNLTYDELIELAPVKTVIKIKIEGDKDEYLGYTHIIPYTGKDLKIFSPVDDYDEYYPNVLNYLRKQSGKLNLILNPFENIKPEPYKVGDVVEVLENALEEHIGFVGKRFKIDKVSESYGYYLYVLLEKEDYCKFGHFPHYCLRKVVEKEEKPVEMTVTELQEKLGIKNLKIISEK